MPTGIELGAKYSSPFIGFFYDIDINYYQCYFIADRLAYKPNITNIDSSCY